jgi:hypothetical protein
MQRRCTLHTQFATFNLLQRMSHYAAHNAQHGAMQAQLAAPLIHARNAERPQP